MSTALATAIAVPSCLHCKRFKAQKDRRGLCKTCARVKAVYYSYPMRKYRRVSYPARGNKAPNLYGTEARGACGPTDAEPGSAAKIAVLAERFRLRQQLWHPADRKLPGGRPALAAGLARPTHAA